MLTRQGTVPSLDAARGLVDRFCRSWGLMTPADHVRRIAALVGNYAEGFVREAGSDEHRRATVEVLAAISRGYAALATRILDEPQSYFSGRAYCDRWRDFPGAPRYVVADGESTCPLPTPSSSIAIRGINSR